MVKFSVRSGNYIIWENFSQSIPNFDRRIAAQLTDDEWVDWMNRHLAQHRASILSLQQDSILFDSEEDVVAFKLRFG